MMFFASLKMMLLVSLAMMRCLPLCVRRHTSLGVAVIIGTANIICRRQTSFKKRTFVDRQKCVFCCLRTTKRCVKWGKNGKKYTRTLLDKLEFVNLCNLFYFSMYSSIKIVSKHLRILLHSAMNPPPDSFYKGC